MNAMVKIAVDALSIYLRQYNYKSSMAYRPTPKRPSRGRRRAIQNWVYRDKCGRLYRGMLK